MDRRRLDRDLPARVDDAGPAPHDGAAVHVHERIGHGNIVEAVEPRRLEIEAQHLASCPCSHAAEHGSGW